MLFTTATCADIVWPITGPLPRLVSQSFLSDQEGDMASAPRICFDRVIPSSYNPARAMAHAAALSTYRSAVQAKALSVASAAHAMNFSGQVAAIQQPLGTLSANDPVPGELLFRP
jgi:hypothetical protein